MLNDKSIDVVAIKNCRDILSSFGRIMMKIIYALEEWASDMLIERTNSGLARIFINVSELGRKKITNETVPTKIITLRTAKKSIWDICVSTAMLQRKLKKVS